jgi:LysM repeat protein
VYKVSAADSIQQLADKYKTTAEKIVAFNDLELTNTLPVDQYIFIPDGERPADPVTNFSGGFGTVSVVSGFVPRFGGNGYSFGYCTYWAAGRRAETGNPIPSNWGNANTWDEYSRASGYLVDNVPAVGAILQYDGGAEGIYHVAYVEEVRADGSVVISEMNVAGWNRLSYRTFTPAQAAAYDYIH